jgi:hypothetical protein
MNVLSGMTVFVLSISFASMSEAQAASPGKPAVSGKPSFSGSWVLNRDLSDMNPQVGFGQGQGSSQRRGGGGGGGRRGGFGGFGGFGGSGGGFGGGGQRNRETPEQQKTLDALTDELRKPSSTLLVSQDDASLAMTDAQGHTRVFQINGKKESHQLASGTVDSKTKWDGDRIVTEYEVGNGQKVQYSYSIVPNSGQLLEQILFEGGEGRKQQPIKHVYDPAPAEASGPAPSVPR